MNNDLLKIEVRVADCISFASVQNAIPVLHSIKVHNMSDCSVHGVHLTVTAYPAFAHRKTWRIDTLSEKTEISITNTHLDYDFAFFEKLNEAVRGGLRFILSKDKQILTQVSVNIRVLARDQWGGLENASTLAAFVAPNSPIVAEHCRNASLLLEKNGYDGALDGYKSKMPKKAYMLVQGLWIIINRLSLSYAEPPASFEKDGQKIRSPERIQRDKLATCLDSSLLFASAIEAVGLNPIILFARKHTFVGFWSINATFPRDCVHDIVEVRKAIAAKELFVFESTLVTYRPATNFEQAMQTAQRYFEKAYESDFSCAVDIRRARHMGIMPLVSRSITNNAMTANEGAVTSLPLNEPDLTMFPTETIEYIPKTAKGRIERWQQRLLDLTLRNRLLNFKNTKQSVLFSCPNLSKLEDMLSAGKRLRVVPFDKKEFLGSRSAEIHQQQQGSNLHEAFLTKELEQKRLCIALPANDLNTRLITLYRKAKSELSEGGANTLYLALGFLHWIRNDTDKIAYHAPILLVPISLQRASVQSDFYIVKHEDDIRINSTLLQLLQKDFGLQLQHLNSALPTDKSGIDVPRVFEVVRKATREITGFEVVEDAALATFSFAKFLMWKDLVDRSDALRNNRLARYLIDAPDKPFYSSTDSSFPRARDLDKIIHPQELTIPLPADSSQLAVTVAAMQGRDFVVIGPPGTGKSQSIANIIAQCLFVGKRVLFVAEKSAALNVVFRRLKACGLGDICLELHSNKGDRKNVLAQLGQAWERSTDVAHETWLRKTEQLKQRQDKLNAYVAQLHASGTHGFSIFQAIGHVVGRKPLFNLEFNGLATHNANMFQRLEKTVEAAAKLYHRVKDCQSFENILCTDYSFAWEKTLVDHAEALATAVTDLQGAMAMMCQKMLIVQLKGNSFEQAQSIQKLNEICKMASAQDLSHAMNQDISQLKKALVSLSTIISTVQKIRTQLVATYDDTNIKKMPLGDIDRQWREANAKIWPFSALGRRKITKLLQTYATTGEADVAREIVPLQELKTNLIALENHELKKFDFFQGVATNITAASSYLDAVFQLQCAIEAWQRNSLEAGGSCGLLRLLCSAKRMRPEFLLLSEDFCKKYDSFIVAYGDYLRHTHGAVQNESLEDIAQNVLVVIQQKARLRDWVLWVHIQNQAHKLGLAPFLSALKVHAIENPIKEFYVAYFSWWLPLAIDASTALRNFRYWAHEDLIKEFNSLDAEVQALASTQILSRTFHKLPAKDRVSRNSELGILRHQMGLHRPSLSIRNLIESMPSTFTKLAQCMLMSPLSIAQYIPSNQTQFDIVIFDEASQITTWDAVGAIARAAQTVIVGDPKQLPPTSFFERAEEEAEEESNESVLLSETEFPSILEEAIAAGLSALQLKWHYRSRDEALIAFSNYHYYNGGLITFPSPRNDLKSLLFHKHDGLYDRGKSRTNRTEAEHIVTFVVDKLLTSLATNEAERPSIGIITFNIQQQELILNLLDVARHNEPRLEWFFSDERDEPVLVKNIENMQGDERDIICFSITFGWDIAGKLSLSFGALNKNGGEKRLNVAVTRSRLEMHVFSSLSAKDIDISRTKSRGVAHLQNFLDYVERGTVALPAFSHGSVGTPESPFEEAVMSALQDKGWNVQPQIGVSNYRIDLGIVHPDHAGVYLAGIECDGATYHSSASARDRDKIREEVLRGLGWNILRIWSTDWFMDPTDGLNAIHLKLSGLLKKSRQKTDR